MLNKLRALGLRISIDDFGTGFSCLSYLHRLPLQVLQIDRSFIARMDTNMESLQIVNTIVVLAQPRPGSDRRGRRDHRRCRTVALHGLQLLPGLHASPPVAEERLLSLLTSSP